VTRIARLVPVIDVLGQTQHFFRQEADASVKTCSIKFKVAQKILLTT